MDVSKGQSFVFLIDVLIIPEVLKSCKILSLTLRSGGEKMKKLSQFLEFDMNEFSSGKLYQVTGIREWVDYNTKVHMGVKIDTIIAKDTTSYRQKDGELVTNQYERLTFKIKKDVKVPLNAYIMPINAVGIVYGEYRNQLAVTADDVKILQSKTTA